MERKDLIRLKNICEKMIATTSEFAVVLNELIDQYEEQRKEPYGNSNRQSFDYNIQKMTPEEIAIEAMAVSDGINQIISGEGELTDSQKQSIALVLRDESNAVLSKVIKYLEDAKGSASTIDDVFDYNEVIDIIKNRMK